MKARTWKIGELARATGLSVRALHYYEQIGLLEPSTRTESGHRVFAERDVLRLQQILSLKQLGLPLEEIKKCLADRTMTPLRVIGMHRVRMEEERDRVVKLHSLLSRLEAALAAKKTLSVEEFMKTIEGMTLYEKYLTKAQLQKMSTLGKKLGQKKVDKVKAEWPRLIAAMKTAMEKGTHPNHPAVQKLARRWHKLSDLFTGGDPDIGLRLQHMYRDEPAARARRGMEPKLVTYVGEAMFCLSKAALRKTIKN